METPEIRGLAIRLDDVTGRWVAEGYIEGIGWLKAQGTAVDTALEALQHLAAKRVAAAADRKSGADRDPRKNSF